MNTVSSTKAEIAGAGDFLKDIIWARHFFQVQGFDINSTKMYQNNMSAMMIEKNGQASLGKRSRYVNVSCFFEKGRLDSNDINVELCNTYEMIAEFFAKPLRGKKVRIFKSLIMGHVHTKSIQSKIENESTTPEERVVENLDFVAIK